MTVYAALLLLHSYLRWAVLISLALSAITSLRGWWQRRDWSKRDERLQRVLVGLADTQLLLGLCLYFFLSPFSRGFLVDPRGAMHSSVLRFFGVEHITAMLLALVVLHVGRVLTRRAASARRQKRAAITALAALALIVIGIPWPGLRYARPLLRMPELESSTVPGCPPLYAERCAACHGAHGAGDGPGAAALDPRPRAFANPSWGSLRDNELADIIREGGAAHSLSAAMPAHPDLSSDQISSLVQCLRRLHRDGAE